jgi:hypothetical protein
VNKAKTVAKTVLPSFSGVSRIMTETYRITSIRRLTAGLSLLTLAVIGLTPVRAHASLPVGIGEQLVTSVAAAPGGGFWIQVDQWGEPVDPYGETLAKDGAPVFENVSRRGSIAAIPGRNGYWVVSDDGQIFARGDAPQLCEGLLSNCRGVPRFPKYAFPDQIIVGAAATPSGNGLWALGRDGKVWPAGDAQSYGDVTSDPQVPTGIAATPSGKGYYVVLEDGGVYSFGDAVFYGSTGGKKPGGDPVTGIALSIADNGNVNGYWLIAANGAVYTFGQAPFWGNAGITDWKVTSIVSFPAQIPGEPPQRTRGYAWVFNNGEVRAVYGS